MRFEIEPTAHTKGTVPTSWTSLPDAEAVECMRREFEKLIFSPYQPQSGCKYITVVYPIMFSPTPDSPAPVSAKKP